MLAIIAAIFFALAAFGVQPNGINFALLALAFLALHFAYRWEPWARGRSTNPNL